MSAPAKPVHTVQVRELVEFVLRQGDLGAQSQFVGPDRTLAGSGTSKNPTLTPGWLPDGNSR